MEQDGVRQALRRSRLGANGEQRLCISNTIVDPSLINDNGKQFFWQNYRWNNTVPETTAAFCSRVDEEEHIQLTTQHAGTQDRVAANTPQDQ